jgi:hypothetical protein
MSDIQTGKTLTAPSSELIAPRGLTTRDFVKALLGGVAALSTDLAGAAASEQLVRAPAVPLITCDPYLSIWSNGNRLTDVPTEHWTGKPHRLTSFVKIDGKIFRIMGDGPKGIPALPQATLTIHPTRTIYEFEGGGIHLIVSFMTAALPDDLTIVSRPLGYINWTVRSVDGRRHACAIYFDASTEIAVNNPAQRVVWSNEDSGDLMVLRAGSAEQTVLEPKGDDVRIDWGYLYIATATASGTTSAIATRNHARRAFGAGNKLANDSNLQMPRAVDEDAPVLALSFDTGDIGDEPVSRWAMLAYDDIYAIQFFEENLRPFWRRNGTNAIDLLKTAASEYPALQVRCESFDRELIADAEQLGGKKYGEICCLAYRQCIAGTKIVADTNGQPLLFPKENTSNGCIGTVDVVYPMAPQFLLFGPSLTKAMLVYNLEYAQSSRWHFPFAPHDVGTYPQADGQVYGGGEETETDQMPIEETGNMLILLAALAQIDNNVSFFEPYWPTIQKWADYLKAEGFDPKNQLCTDDFAGHLAHNVNLSAKAIIGLGAYGQLCRMRGETATADEYTQLARQYGARWIEQANDGDHFRLTFDHPGSWSQKYNLVWDRILELDLFPANALRKEMAFYRRQMNRYGLPLDSRSNWTKTDWTLWTATLTGSRDDFQALTGPVYEFLSATPDRVPFSDFYWTTDATDAGMHARPVIGGVFLRFLYDKTIWKKWAGRDKTRAAGWAPFPRTA